MSTTYRHIPQGPDRKGRYTCPQEVRAAHDYGQKGVQTEARRPEKKKAKKKNIRKKERSKRWHDALAKVWQCGTQVVTVARKS